MSFSTVGFIFAFLPALLIVYFIMPRRMKNITLVISSLVFYATFIVYGGTRSIAVLGFSIVFNYLLGIWLDTNISQGWRKAILVLGLGGNLLPLAYYKYFNFVATNINYYLNFNVSIREVLLPLGISFFTFKALSYLIDIYRQKVKAERNIIDFALYLSIFTQIISGPIMPYSEMRDELKHRVTTLDSFTYGIRRFCYGLAKKVLIADILGQTVDIIFTAATSQQIDMPTAWLGMICYTLQIYFDFSGYTDMAIGLGKMLGLSTMENFNYPYISRSVTEFWRRWHISLSSWFRNYLYIPMGGNRYGNVYLHLFIVFLVTGIWHGANWTFIVWGLWHGFFVITERMISHRSWYKQIPAIVKTIVTLLAVALGWVLFRAASLTDAITYFQLLFGLAGDPLPEFTILYYLNPQLIFTLIIACFLSVPLIPKLTALWPKEFYLNASRTVLISILLIVSLMFVMTSTYNPFIYFQF